MKHLLWCAVIVGGATTAVCIITGFQSTAALRPLASIVTHLLLGLRLCVAWRVGPVQLMWFCSMAAIATSTLFCWHQRKVCVFCKVITFQVCQMCLCAQRLSFGDLMTAVKHHIADKSSVCMKLRL